ncbi:MAG: trigger factor, partial [Lachnospiraceae bacterium]|nr:trigger factor [Lachnospiraceae bacterium]
MSCSVEKLEGSMAVLTIELPAEELDKAIKNDYQRLKGRINVPGFRKGKVPMSVIEKVYGPEMFYEGASRELINENYRKEIETVDEEIVSSADIDIVQLEKGKPFIFTAKVALKPESTLSEYKGLKVEKTDRDVSDEDVEEYIMGERRKNSEKKEVTRPVKDTDEITLDFEGFVDGTPFEGGKGEDYKLTIGSGAFIPGFEEQLIGAEIGVEKDVNVTFPEDYHEKSLAGKESVFKCTVKSIKEVVLPEADDAFADEVSEFETMDEYRADVRKKLEERKAKAADSTKQENALKELARNLEVEIPTAMLETEERGILDEFEQQLYFQGLSFDQYMKSTGQTRERMMQQVEPDAEERIKTRLALEHVIEKENI